MTTDELKELLDEFLDRWPIEDVENMTLHEYVSVGNKDTFCQWVETKTKMLGSIKGLSSIKFGIYERKKQNKRPVNYDNDNKYSWLRRYGKSRRDAFENVKKDLLKIIRLSEKGKFEQIDKIILPDLFKWKVAFLYSNERLIPIYKREVLLKIGKHFGLNVNRETTISEIQAMMVSNKPSNQNIYDYMRELYDKFGSGKEKETITRKSSKQEPRKRRRRSGTANRNTQTHLRTVNRSYIVEQKHNKIQEALRKQLADKYGEENVILEENHVDVKLIQSTYLGLYEVKSSSYASECIREALGQILLYSYYEQDERQKKIFVVGQYPANVNDLGYIKYIKEKLDLDFEYLNVEFD